MFDSRLLAELPYIVAAILIAITIHEFSHAFIAYQLGDGTAKALGRVSLNPLVHLDPFGTIMIILSVFSQFGIGWGKPVPVNPSYLKPNPKTGMALVSAAGPLSNILTAFVLFLPVRLDLFSYDNDAIAALVQYIIMWSIGLGAFNLLPLPPLDGFSIALGILPRSLAFSFGRLAQYGIGPLMLIIIADSYFHLGILQVVLGPVYSAIGALVTGRPFF